MRGNTLNRSRIFSKVATIPLVVGLIAGGAAPYQAFAASAENSAPLKLSGLTASLSQPALISPEINTNSTKMVRVIVQLTAEPAAVGMYASEMGVSGLTAESAEQATDSQQATLISRAKANGINLKVNYQFNTVLNGMEVTIPANQIPALAALPGVKSVNENHTYFSIPREEQNGLDVNSPYFDINPLEQIGVPAAWAKGLDGSHMKVGVIDTGIDYKHPDLQGAYKGGYDSINQDDDPYEDIPDKDSEGSQHGTHVSGTIAGRAANTTSDIVQKGIAYNADLYAYKVLGYNPETGRASGSSAQVIDGIEHAVEAGMDVINLSLGSDSEKDVNTPDSIAINNAVMAGVTAVIANGNAATDGGDGYYYSMGSPASSQLAISVGAASSESKHFSGSVSWLLAQPPQNLTNAGEVSGAQAGTEVGTEPAAAEPAAVDPQQSQEAASVGTDSSSGSDAAASETASGEESTPSASAQVEANVTPSVTPSADAGSLGMNLMAWRTAQDDFHAVLGTDPIEGVYVGLGLEDDYAKDSEGNDLVKGKVAFISRGKSNFTDKVAIAKSHGAKAVVLFNGINAGDVPNLDEASVSDSRNGAIGSSGYLGDSLDYVPTFDMPGIEGRALARELMAHPEMPLTFTFGSDYTNATQAGDKMAYFSSRGPNSDANLSIKPDLVAPGVNIMSTWPAYGLNDPNASYSEAYSRISGTSMATPHVAGLALLLKQEHPNWTPFDIRAALANTADEISDGSDVPVPYDVYSQGAGRVDIAKAIDTPAVLQTVDKITIKDKYLQDKQVDNYSSSASFGIMAAGDAAKEEKLQVKNFSDTAVEYTASVVMHPSVTSDPGNPIPTPDVSKISAELSGLTDGDKITVDPATGQAAGTAGFSLNVAPMANAIQGVYEGEVRLQAQGVPTLHLPFVVHVGNDRPANGFGVQDVVADHPIITTNGTINTTDVKYKLTANDANYVALNVYSLDDEILGTINEKAIHVPGQFYQPGDYVINNIDGTYTSATGKTGQHLQPGMYKLEIAAYNCALDDSGEYILDKNGDITVYSGYTAYTAFRVTSTDMEAVLSEAETFHANIVNTTQLNQDVLKFPENTGFSYKVIKSSNTGYIDDNGVLKKIPATAEPAFKVELKVEVKRNDASTTVRVPVTIQPAAAPAPSPAPSSPVTQPKPNTSVNPSIPAVIGKGQNKVEVGTTTEKNGIGVTLSMKDEDLVSSIKSAGNSAAAFILAAADTDKQQLKATISPSQVQALAQAPAQSTVVVNSGGSSVSLPVSLMGNVPGGSGVEVIIAPNASKQTQFTSQAAGSSVVGSPVSYEVNVVGSQGSTPIKVNKTPIKRSFTVDGTIQPGTAGVLYEEEGVIRPVASVFTPQANGTTIVTVSRPGFSTYAAVTRPVNFKDISTSWAESQIQSMASKLLINGTSATTFSPQANVTRAEFASILARSLGLVSQDKAVFSDVPSGAWYAADVAAAYEAGLLKGTGNGKFDPNAPLTREQLSVILSKAISLLNISTSNPSHTTYGDNSKVSGYAKDSVQAVTEAGLMRGEIANGISYFRPGAITSREMAAATIWQLLVKAQLVE